jgi:hypothetical protein
MTISELQDNVATITEETWSQAEFLVRLNRVVRQVLSDRDFSVKEYKTAYTTSTSSQALPTNNIQVNKVMSSDGLIEYSRIPFSEQNTFGTYQYWIDEANSTIYFGGSGDTVNVFWQLQSTDLTISDTLPLPSQFHDLYLAGIVVDYFLGEDVDDVNNKKAELWANRFDSLMGKLRDWDAKIKCNEINGIQRVYSDEYLIAKGIVPNYYD